MMVICTGTGPASASAITWRLEAGFAPFTFLKEPGTASEAWLPRSKDGTFPTFEEWYRDLHRKGLLSGSPYEEWLTNDTSGSRSPWNPTTGHYDPTYARPSAVTLVAKADVLNGTCQWTVIGATGVERIVTEDGEQGGAPLAAPCSEEVRIPDVALRGEHLSVSNGQETLRTPIEIEHRVVVALGDSYASGEGNPDVPTGWKHASAPRDTHDWLNPEHRATLFESDAKWFDQVCHRSFWSHQSYVALRMAAENPKRLVTFLHYSCSGAEIFDGLLTPQYLPPGMSTDCRVIERQPGSGLRKVDDSQCHVPRSQLNAMVTDLCGPDTPVRTPTIDALDKALVQSTRRLDKMESFRDRGNGNRGIDAVACRAPRKPDLILLSIGGNDAGFAQLVAWALTPSTVGRTFLIQGLYNRLRGGKIVCPAHGVAPGVHCPQTDQELINQFPTRFAALAGALESVLPGASERVVLNSYPAALTQAGGTRLRACADPRGELSPLNAWDGLRSIDGVATSWPLNITEGEVGSLLLNSPKTSTVSLLRHALHDAASRHGFRFAHNVATTFDGHGWCVEQEADQPIALPSRAPERWSCPPSSDVTGNPACWNAYQPSARYIRTINDSLLTQTSKETGGLSGAVHPNALGHAAIAEALYREIGFVLPPASD